MPIQFRAPLQPGDLIGVRPPTVGVRPDYVRANFAVARVRRLGSDVVVGACMGRDGKLTRRGPGFGGSPKDRRLE
jgi:hypothetical protein